MPKLWIKNLGLVIICILIYRDLVSVPYSFIIKSNIDKIKREFKNLSEVQLPHDKIY